MKVWWKSVPGGRTGVEVTFPKSCSCSWQKCRWASGPQSVSASGCRNCENTVWKISNHIGVYSLSDAAVRARRNRCPIVLYRVALTGSSTQSVCRAAPSHCSERASLRDEIVVVRLTSARNCSYLTIKLYLQCSRGPYTITQLHSFCAPVNSALTHRCCKLLVDRLYVVRRR